MKLGVVVLSSPVTQGSWTKHRQSTQTMQDIMFIYGKTSPQCRPHFYFEPHGPANLDVSFAASLGCRWNRSGSDWAKVSLDS